MRATMARRSTMGVRDERRIRDGFAIEDSDRIVATNAALDSALTAFVSRERFASDV